MDDSKLQAIKYFIKEAPVGELKLVLSDIEALLQSSDHLNDPQVREAIREHYEAHVSHHSIPD